MAINLLTSGETANGGQPVFGNNSYFGTVAGAETVVVGGGQQIFGADFNAGGDTIILSGAASAYSISRSGSTIIITGPNGTEVRLPAPNPTLTVAQQPNIVFNNGTLGVAGDDVSFKLSTTTAGAFSLGTQAITTTATAVGGGTPNPNPSGGTLNVSIQNPTAEGGVAIVTLTLSQAPTAPVTVNVLTSGGTATPGSDYTLYNTPVTFAAGQTTQVFQVQTSADGSTGEAAETIQLIVTPPTGIALASGANLTITLPQDVDVARQFELTTGNDTAVGGAAPDRIVGAQNTTLPGKLLSANDIVNGGDGVDTLELTNAVGNATPNVLADLDMTNVTNVEALVTNYASVQLGAQADKAGIVTVDTRTRTDSGNNNNTNPVNGTVLDLTSDANGDGTVDFNNTLAVTMGNSTTDTIRFNLAAAAGSTFDTGATFTPAATVGNPNPVAFGAIDTLNIVGGSNPVRVTFTSTAVGNGSAVDAGTSTLAVQLQAEDGNDALTGGIVRADDEGLNLVGTTTAGTAQLFDVRDISGTQRGTFAQVILGTSLGETLNASVATGAYINGGGGDDTVNGTNAVDFLVGGSGNDILVGNGGADSLLGGTGNDILNGGAGIDSLDGQAGSDFYVYDDGEFVASEALNDSGTDATDIDFIAIRSVSAITDAQFVGRTGIEGLVTNVTNGAGAEVTAGAAAQATGITSFITSDDDLNASAYTVGVRVFGRGSITTGSGNDTVTIYGTGPSATDLRATVAQQNYLNLLGYSLGGAALQSYTGTVVLGAGDDVLNSGYSLANIGGNNTLTGGAGVDTLTFGGTPNLGGGFNTNVNLTATGANALGAYVLQGGTGFTGFERIVINATTAPTGGSNAVSYTIRLINDNIATGTRFDVDAGALRGSVVVAGLDGILGTADDVTTQESLVFDGTAVTGDRAVSVFGGAGADQLDGTAGNDLLNGSGGNDLIRGFAGDDTLIGGAGNDALVGGAGTDTMDGGEGDDEYRFTNDLIAADIINDSGAGGNDAITVASTAALTDALFANKAGVEILNTSVTNGAGAEVTIGTNAQASGIRYVNVGDDDLDASAYTAGLFVTTGIQVLAGVPTTFVTPGNVTTGSGNDQVLIAGTFALPAGGAIVLNAGDDTLLSGYALSAGAAATATLSGGAGRDTLVVGGAERALFGISGDTSTDTYDFGANANFTGFEQITVAATGDAPVAVAGAGNDLAGNAPNTTITLATQNIAAGTTFTVDASALVAVVTGLGADGEIGGTGANADVTTTPILTLNAGGVGDRSLVVTGGAGADVINTGAGADTINGGLGNDVISAGAGADVIDGGEGDDTITGGAGFDTIRGGAGNDTIILNVSEFNSDADNVDGGAGNDILQINGTANTPQEIADVGFNGRFTSIEEVRLVGAAGGTPFTYNAGFYSQTAGVNLISLGANASGSTVSVASYTQGGPGNFPAPAVTLRDTVVTTNNATFTGSNFNDTFDLGVTNNGTTAGGAQIGGGTDFVRAGAGDDVINFGSTYTGADLVDGGTGNDTLNVSGNGTTQTVAFAIAAVGGTTPTSGIYAVERIVLASGIANTATAAGTATSYTLTAADTAFVSDTASLTVDGSGLRLISTGAGVDGIFGTTDDVTTAEVLNYNGGAVTGTRVQVVTGGAGGDTITGGAGADTLSGNDGNDTINGGGGNDVIDGGAGDDALNGGAGNDTITGGAGSDAINGGAGVDVINLGSDGARDTVTITNGEAPRADQAGIETVNGFVTGTIVGPDGIAGNGDDVYTATADVLDFGSGLINENSTSITNGVVQAGSVLAGAINTSTSLLAAIQLVEQEFQSDGATNNGVVAFTYNGNLYVGEISGVQGTEAFTDIIQVTGVTNVTGLTDVDAGGPGTGLGLYI